jgi:hypothetical protein
MVRLGVAVLLLHLLVAFNARADHPSDEIQNQLDVRAAWAPSMTRTGKEPVGYR